MQSHLVNALSRHKTVESYEIDDNYSNRCNSGVFPHQDSDDKNDR